MCFRQTIYRHMPLQEENVPKFQLHLKALYQIKHTVFSRFQFRTTGHALL